MKRIFWLTLSLLIITACRGRGVVPEITPHLLIQNIFSASQDQSIVMITRSDSHLVFIDSKHTISRFDPENNRIDSIYQLATPVETDVFCRNHWLVMKYRDRDGLAIFDLREMKMIAEVKGKKPQAILGVDDRALVYRDKDVHIYDHQAGKILHSIPLQDKILGNLHITGTDIYILTQKELTVFNRPRNSLSVHTLADMAASGFLYLNDSIYYGSTGRELIRFSLSSRQPVWKFKLAMRLDLSPELAGGYIVATPRDNNIYFFKASGTLHWWETLDSTQKMAAVPMEENVAVFLMNDSVKFFNFKTKETSEYKLKSKPIGRPVYFKHFLYGLSRTGDELPATVSRLGNLYQVQIKMEPESLKPVGRSIRVSLNPINLINPHLDISILNEKEEKIFKKTLAGKENLSFVWIPQDVGSYQLVLDIASKNKKPIQITKSFKTVDLKKIIERSNFRVLKKCQFDKIR